MVQSISRAQVHQRLHAIRTAQKNIRDRIKQIQEQLKRLESEPGSPVWVTFRRTQNVEELRSRFPTLPKALQHDVQMLKSQTRDLQRQALHVRTHAAQQASHDFKKRLEEALKRAEQHGTMPESELATLRSDGETVLKQFVGILDSNPSPKNIGLVLSELEIPLLLGADSEGGACGDAARAVSRASERIVERRERAFRQNAGEANFDKLLQARALAQQVGGKSQETPAGWKPVNKTHIVAPGDTLAEISKRYYKKPGFWDIIYIENYGVIGDDVRSLRVGTTLKIP